MDVKITQHQFGLEGAGEIEVTFDGNDSLVTSKQDVSFACSDTGSCVEFRRKQTLLFGPTQENLFLDFVTNQLVFCTDDQFAFLGAWQNAIDVVAKQGGVLIMKVGQFFCLVVVNPQSGAMRADIGILVAVLVDGVDSTHIDGCTDFVELFQSLVEFVQSVNGTNP